MAKEQEQNTARIMFVEQGKTQKEIATLLNVTEKTVGNWSRKGNWRAARDAFLTAPRQRVKNIKEIISVLAERRLAKNKELEKAELNAELEQCETIRREIAAIDDAVAKWNKTLANIDKENNITLGTYLQVMDRIFRALQEYDTKVFLKTVDFQTKHINDVTINYG